MQGTAGKRLKTIALARSRLSFVRNGSNQGLLTQLTYSAINHLGRRTFVITGEYVYNFQFPAQKGRVRRSDRLCHALLLLTLSHLHSNPGTFGLHLPFELQQLAGVLEVGTTIAMLPPLNATWSHADASSKLFLREVEGLPEVEDAVGAHDLTGDFCTR
jgi:hypothetical protein